MKFMKLLIAFCIVTILSACAGLPAPKNANGSFNPSVAIGEAEVAYSDATTYAADYASKCHADMTIIGCKESIITSLKAASDTALKSLFAAETAVRKLPPTATSGAEQEIATATKDINALKSMTPKH